MSDQTIGSLPAAIYVHIPFCVRKCPYCDFTSYSGREHLFSPYVQALGSEIHRMAARFPDAVISTIYFGGGTPNILPCELLHNVLAAIRACFTVTTDAEITIEANPGLHDRQGGSNAQCLGESGFTRLSLGFQSLNNVELKLLGRIHTKEDAVLAFHEARDAGFENINVDLMYGIPGQTLDSWCETLDATIALAPEHVSLYSLSVEEGTPFWDMYQAGSLQPPSTDAEADMYVMAVEKLKNHGFLHYEISNFARPNFQCRHNITYWKNEPYFGFGAGATSCLEGTAIHRPECLYVRATNVRDVEEYIRRSQAEEHLAEIEDCADRKTAMGETMFLGLRMLEGVDTHGFRQRYGAPIQSVFGPEISELMRRELLEETDRHIRLTSRGLLLANEVFIKFVG
ncbi:MAG: radical SAM family heme chaperone HemW [Armatimonadota bacterium]